MSIYFRAATPADIPAVVHLIEQGRAYFAAHGIPQWQGANPNITDITADVAEHTSYLLEHDGAVIATAVMITRPEPTYAAIHQGAWPSAGQYATLHRVAVEPSRKQQGTASLLLQHLEQHAAGLGMPAMRVDTHRLNLPMQALLKKCGYAYCGIIYLEDGAERFAYEKALLAP